MTELKGGSDSQETQGTAPLQDLDKVISKGEHGDDSAKQRELILSRRSLCAFDLSRFIPFSTSLSDNLRRLNLSRNRLESLPTELFSLFSLEHLDLSRNQLTGIPTEIQQLRNLVSLVLLSNKLRLRLLPVDEIASLLYLDLVDVRYNPKLEKGSARATLSSRLPTRVTLKTSGGQASENGKKESACDRDPNELRSQLEPLSTPQLRKRLSRAFDVEIKDDDENAFDREYVIKTLLKAYDQQCPVRMVRNERGVPVSEEVLRGLLKEMEAISWPGTTRERPKIAAEYYMILQKPVVSNAVENGSTNAKRQAAKLEKYGAMWDKAVAAIKQTDQGFAERFTALAVTKNFRGSPHIDTLNIGPFYAISMGNFSGGGKLCVECSATTIAQVDTNGCFAKIDGRFPHWVSDYEGTRYSLIYYVTRGEVIPQTTAIFEPPVGQEGASWVPPPSYMP